MIYYSIAGVSDLFDLPGDSPIKPLAARMRPRTLDEYVGQGHLLGEGSPVRRAIEAGTLGSVVLWAPPGCGKTTLAHLIAAHMDAHLEVASAVTAGVADIRKIAEAASDRRKFSQKRTVLLLDEIHHFNKSQQDSLLGYLEDGLICLVGATTENPFFALNGALVSRARVLPMHPLGVEDIGLLLDRALEDVERGLGGLGTGLDDEGRAFIVRLSQGDARTALGLLETSALLTPQGGTVQRSTIERVALSPGLRYDKTGDNHYDTVSAFIKSVRGSDSDAALHYLARMIEAGEDPRFIARRLVVLASEDIGNAEPQGLVVAMAAFSATQQIGMPEARIVLAQATTFLAEAPKSNASYLGIERAIADVRDGRVGPVPLHLRNAPTEGVKSLGHGEGYLYPHDHAGGWVEQGYLPDAELGTPYYEPVDRGYEAKMIQRRDARREPGKG